VSVGQVRGCETVLSNGFDMSGQTSVDEGGRHVISWAVELQCSSPTSGTMLKSRLGFDTTCSHANNNFTLTENEGDTLDRLDQC
jgi:hypothetical protein